MAALTLNDVMLPARPDLAFPPLAKLMDRSRAFKFLEIDLTPDVAM